MRNIESKPWKNQEQNEANNPEYNSCKNDLRDLFTKLDSWKEESQREFSTFMLNTYAEFSNIMSSQSTLIDMRVNSLVEEASCLQAQLSIITEERNDLNETVENLSWQNKSLKDKLEGNLEDNMQEVKGFSENSSETKDEGVEETILSRNDSDLEDNPSYGEITNELAQETNKIQSNIQNNWEINDIEQVSPSEEIPEKVEGGHQEEEREEMPANFEGVDENKLNDVREEMLVQFEDAKGDLHTLIRSVADKARRRHACENCPYTSTSRSHLREHTENVHEKIRRHFCKECNYASYRKRGLNHHIKVVHEKSMHVCEDCGYSIERKALLNSHRASVHGVNINPRA